MLAHVVSGSNFSRKELPREGDSSLLSQEPFVDFSGSDPQAKAILVKTAFELYDLILSRGGSRALVIL